MSRYLSLVFFLVPCVAGAAELDPGYLKAFGPGSITASSVGYPEIAKYDPSQFRYKNGVFTIQADGTLDLRSLLPRGMTVGKALARAKKERGANLKHRQGDFMSFRIWMSHDHAARDLTGGHPWPTKLSDVPIWSPITDQRYDITAENMTWPGAGVRWSDIKASMTNLRTAKIGHKLYVVFSVGYRYKTPGGQMESKWDDVRRKFVQVRSTGLLGFVHGAPLAACTIEIGAGPDQSARFSKTGDGITDSKSGLTWAQPSSVEKRYQEVPQYLKGLRGSGWRLPTVEELVALRKAGGEKPAVWFNGHGFTGVHAEAYWTSNTSPEGRIRVVDMGGTTDPGVLERETATWIWPVKGK